MIRKVNLCIAIALISISIAACSSSPSAIESNSSYIKARIITDQDLRQYNKGTINPFKEWKSLISSPTARFVVIELSILQPGDNWVELVSTQAIVGGQPIETKALIKDDLVAYWRQYLDETMHPDLYMHIDRKALPERFRVLSGKEKKGYVVIAIPYDSPVVESCQVSILVNDRPIEIDARP